MWVSCAHHLYLEVAENGTVKYVFPDLEVDEMGETCALDVAEWKRDDNVDWGKKASKQPERNQTLETVAKLLNVTREAVRLTEKKAMKKIEEELDDVDD